MTNSRAQFAGIMAGVSLLIAAAAPANAASVDIHPAYPDPVVGSPGDTVEVVVSVVGVEGWQACQKTLLAESQATCDQFQADYNCDEAMWDAGSGDCNLSLCSCVSATQNELVLDPPLSIHQHGDGGPDCQGIPFGWESLFALTRDEGGIERLQADLTGDSGTGVQFVFDGNRHSAKLYTCRVDIDADANLGVYPVACASPSSSDPADQPNFTDCVNGSIEVVARPTPTPTSTSAPTNTPTRKPGGHDDGDCAIVAPADASSAWWLAVPALALLGARRRR